MKTVVLHSGGMDSSICLRLAIEKFGAHNVTAVAFNYSQRHSTELEAASKICEAWAVKQHIVDLTVLHQITESAQFSQSVAIETYADKPPNTFTVGRNGIMVSMGGIYAHKIGARSLWVGVVAPADTRLGYPDTTRAYMDLKQQLLRIDLIDAQFEICTPLVDMTKAETLALAEQLDVLDFLLQETVTCYDGIIADGCGKCPACILRREGLEQYLEKKCSPHHQVVVKK